LRGKQFKVEIRIELSERERQVLLLIRLGKKNDEIADTMGISVNTVKTHLKSLFKKLKVRNRTEASHISTR
jgi:DNA-binding NarL/FixJ family response regulator